MVIVSPNQIVIIIKYPTETKMFGLPTHFVYFEIYKPQLVKFDIFFQEKELLY